MLAIVTTSLDDQRPEGPARHQPCYSPDGQRQAIARYADEHGLELVEDYCDRAFGVDTVREMLCNAAYAGYVSARRDTTIFEGVWLDERRVVAVQPKPSFLPFFENHVGEAPELWGVKYGSDGGRVRD